MKKIILTLLLINSFVLTHAQDVTIPDVKFKNALIEQGVDTNNDSIIQVSEALAVKKLIVYKKSITNLTGIEAFTNLTYLACDTNKITSLDLHANTLLDTLLCNNNQIPDMDISMLPLLTKLNCSTNKFTSFSTSSNLALKWYDIGGCFNTLKSVDISSNVALEYLDIVANYELTNIDLSNNINLQTLLAIQTTKLLKLDVSNNPSLTRMLLAPNFFGKAAMTICVSDAQMANIPSGWSKASGDKYSTTACLPIAIDEFSNVSAPKKLVAIYNLLGEVVNESQATNGLYIYQYSDGSTEKRVSH